MIWCRRASTSLQYHVVTAPGSKGRRYGDAPFLDLATALEIGEAVPAAGGELPVRSDIAMAIDAENWNPLIYSAAGGQVGIPHGFHGPAFNGSRAS